MHEQSLKQLVTINLKYGSSAKSLKTVAFAELAAKVLFISPKSLLIDELCKNMAELLGIQKIAKNFVEDGLNYLKEIRRVDFIDSDWSLRKDEKKEIKRDIEN